MKNKKSQLVYKALVVILIGAFIVIGFVMAGRAYGSRDIFFKFAVAKDIALLIDTISVTPGDITVTYPVDLTGYGIKVAGNKVTLFSSNAGEFDTSSASYDFVGNNAQISAKINNAKELRIIKKGNNIDIT